MKIISLDLYNESRLTYEALGELYAKKDKFRGEDFDAIDSILSNLPNKNIKVLDLGCGNGDFIRYILDNHYETVDKIVGVDFSKSMIESTVKKLKSFKKHKTAMMCMDINDYLSSSKENYDLIIMANNVFGNIVPENNEDILNYRMQILAKIKDMIVPKGYAFISVYNIENLLISEGDYGEDTWRIYDKLNSNDFIMCIEIANKEYHYYTHWFAEGEIINLAKLAGFRNCRSHMKQKRIILTLENKVTDGL